MQGISMVAFYLDDILVSSRTPDEARANLLRVLSRIQAAGLRLWGAKSARLWKTRVFTLVTV